MNETTFYVMVVWASGFIGGFSASCLLAVFAIKRGWMRIKE